MISNRILLIVTLQILLLISLLYSDNETSDEVYSNQFRFAIRYLGMKITEVELIDTRTEAQGSIEVKAKSVSFGRLLFRVDNTYRIEYTDAYIPGQYDKFIKQKNFSHHKRAVFDRSGERLLIWREGEHTEFSGMDLKDCRDFFSALLVLREVPVIHDSFALTIYANNNLWNGQVTYSGNEIIDKRETIKYRILFNQITDNKTQRSDVLTNNIVKEESSLYLWITDDDMRLPLKAEYDASPFSVFWTLEDYDISYSLEQLKPPNNANQNDERE